MVLLVYHERHASLVHDLEIRTRLLVPASKRALDSGGHHRSRFAGDQLVCVEGAGDDVALGVLCAGLDETALEEVAAEGGCGLRNAGQRQSCWRSNGLVQSLSNGE